MKFAGKLVPPSLTTTERNALTGAVAPAIIYNSTNARWEWYNGSTWEALVTIPLKTNGGLVYESNNLAVDLGATSITGTLAATDGGTGQNTYTTGDLLYASSATVLAKRTVGTDVQVLGVSGGVPTWTNFSAYIPTVNNTQDTNTASQSFTTATDTIITNGSRSLVAGTYFVLFSTYGSVSNGARRGQISIYVNGVQQTASIRQMSSTSTNCISTQVIVILGATTTVDVRASIKGGGGTFTFNNSTYNTIRLL